MAVNGIQYEEISSSLIKSGKSNGVVSGRVSGNVVVVVVVVVVKSCKIEVCV